MEVHFLLIRYVTEMKLGIDEQSYVYSWERKFDAAHPKQ